MANRKFHYNDRKSDGGNAEGRQSAPVRQNGRRKQNAAARGAAAARKAAVDAAVAGRYPAEKLALPIAGIGVADELVGLLSVNGIRTAGDLVCRTEREMYKVQGFNMKMLLALKRALSAVGMEFYADAAPDKAAKGAGDSPAQRRKEQPEKPQRTPAAQQRREREERPKKLTEPLPFTEWRKIQKGGKWGFYAGFKTVIPAMYDEVFFFKDGLAAAELDEKCGYINPENEVVIPFDYETAMSFSEGYASVVKGGKCGYINKDNEVVIPFVYDAATPFEGGEAKVKKDGRWGTILPDGSVKWI